MGRISRKLGKFAKKVGIGKKQRANPGGGDVESNAAAADALPAQEGWVGATPTLDAAAAAGGPRIGRREVAPTPWVPAVPSAWSSSGRPPPNRPPPPVPGAEESVEAAPESETFAEEEEEASVPTYASAPGYATSADDDDDDGSAPTYASAPGYATTAEEDGGVPFGYGPTLGYATFGYETLADDTYADTVNYLLSDDEEESGSPAPPQPATPQAAAPIAEEPPKVRPTGKAPRIKGDRKAQEESDLDYLIAYVGDDVATELELLPMFKDDQGRLYGAVSQAERRGRVESSRGVVSSRAYHVRTYASQMVQAVIEDPEIREKKLLKLVRVNYPLKIEGQEVLDYALARGHIARTDQGFEASVGGLGLLARVAASSASDGGVLREKADRSQEGWATLGMSSAHRKHDVDTGVTYNDTAEKREPTILKLVGGVFQWAATGEAASGPDLSAKDLNKPEDAKAIAETSANYVYHRVEECKAQGIGKKEAFAMAVREIQDNPRAIFVMDAAGTFYAANAKMDEIHHSTMLGGAEVAAAGEMALSGGKVSYVSDASGHYMPGPAYTWQAVHELGAQGVNLGGVDLQMFGVSRIVKADWFVKTFVPGLNLSFSSDVAVSQVNLALANGKSGDRAVAADESMGDRVAAGSRPAPTQQPAPNAEAREVEQALGTSLTPVTYEVLGYIADDSLDSADDLRVDLFEADPVAAQEIEDSPAPEPFESLYVTMPDDWLL